MFAYCNNNPVMSADPSGCWLIGALIGGAIVVTSILLTGCSSKQEKEWPADCKYEYESGGTDRYQNNCYSYVFDYGMVRDPGEMSHTNIYYQDGKNQKISNSVFRDAVIADAKCACKRVEHISNEWVKDYKTSRPSGSYLIAAKLSSDRSDYHFAVLLDNNIWVDKPGMNESRYGEIDGFASTWQIGDRSYDSSTIYFLYTP